MQYGRNGMYAFDCDNCGKHHERPLIEINNWRHFLPKFCDKKCQQAQGMGNGMARYREKSIARTDARSITIAQEFRAGVSGRDIMDKYHLKESSVYRLKQRGERLLNKGVDKV